MLTQITRSIKTVSIIGGGLMGSGIAQVSAQSGYNVQLVDLDSKVLEKSHGSIQKNLQRVAKKKFDNEAEMTKFVSDSMGRIKVLTDTEQAAKSSDLIIEAIVENMNVKHELFKKLDKYAPSSCLFASNTSSLSISDISNVTKRQHLFGGLHFFNPVPMMKLVEVVSTSVTDKATKDELTNFAKSLGKVTVQCTDTPGFIVNRLLVPYLGESVRLLERGVASAEDIDLAMKLGAGHPMGPLTLADYVGLDTTKFILDGWHKKFPDNPLFQPIDTIDKLVQENKLGVKTGQGFYDYSKK